MYGRENDFTEMHPGKLAYYDDAITVDLSKVEPMIALPFHPSNVYKLKDVIENPYDILKKVENECKAELNNDKLSFSLTDKSSTARSEYRRVLSRVAQAALTTISRLPQTY